MVNNLIDVTTVYNGCLNYHAIIDIVTELKHPGVKYSTLDADQNKAAQIESSNLYLATMFNTKSDSCCYHMWAPSGHDWS